MRKVKSKNFRKRIIALIALIIITPLGFYTKFYSGPYSEWVNDSLGGLFYVIFWCLIVNIILIRSRAWKIAVFVLLMTSCIEFLQLWHPPFLENLRSNFIGQTILGNSFNPTDFIYYVMGSLLGLSLLSIINEEKKQGF